MVMILVFDTEVRGSNPFIPLMYKIYNECHNVRQVFNKILFLKTYKKDKIYFQNLILPVGFNKNLKKKSKHFILYEFSTSFLQSNVKNVTFFFCRYCKYLELVLEIL